MKKVFDERADVRRRQLEEHERARSARRKAKRLGRKLALTIRRDYARRNGLLFDRRVERHQIVLPPIFSFHENYGPTVAVLEEVREHALRANRTVMLHFTRVERIEPAAALALVAEIHRVRNLRSARSITGTYPASRNVYDLLGTMGFYRLLEISERDDIPPPRQEPGSPIFLPFQSANRVDAKMVDEFVAVLEKHVFRLNKVARTRLVGAIVEAMANTLDHAHPNPIYNETMTKRWWLSCWIDVVNKEVTVLVLDQGVGIPVTLDPTTYERIRAALRNALVARQLSATPSDGEMILAATEFHRTSMAGSRGRGFRDMKRFIDVCPDGELRVLSNCGRYRYVAGTEQHADEESSIGGTVIEWRFRTDGTLELEDE